MHNTFHKIFSIWVLLLFLSPVVAKNIHALEHQEEVHCLEKGSFHLHVAEHKCQLCEHSLTPQYDAPSLFSFYVFDSYVLKNSKHYSFSDSHRCLSYKYVRGPPSII